MSADTEFDDELVQDDDLADDWEAELEAQDKAEEDAKKAAALKAAGGGGGKPKHFKNSGAGADDDDNQQQEDEDELEGKTEDEKRAILEYQRQKEADRMGQDLFKSGGGAGNNADGLPPLTEMPPLASWEPAKNIAELRKVKDRIIEVVVRRHKNPNYSACLVPCFSQLFKGLDTATLEGIRTYLDTCKDKIDVKRAESKKQAAAAEQKIAAAAAPNTSSAAAAAGGVSRGNKVGDLFANVEDKAGTNQRDDEYCMF